VARDEGFALDTAARAEAMRRDCTDRPIHACKWRHEAMNLKRHLFSFVLLPVLALGLHAAAHAQHTQLDKERPGAAAMVADLLVARPLGIAFTAIGTTVFVVSLPFSALGGNVGEAAEKLVVEPARETFVRCLGCTTQHR
jgi:hypothetical protein